jgi:tRNA dimethylallyltransferase
LKGYTMQAVPEDIKLREKMDEMSTEELTDWLNRLRSLHNTTDILDRKRIYRAIEIALAGNTPPPSSTRFKSIIFGIFLERDKIRENITRRLKQRLDNGMIEETRHLLNKGVPESVLKNYGLEYRYLTAHLLGELTYDEMYRLLNTAIHQFAKKQMTWFRRMEKQGFEITWLNASDGKEKNCDFIIQSLNQL